MECVPLASFGLAAFVTAVLAAALFDLSTRTVPNALTAALALGAVATMPWIVGWASFAAACIAALGVLAAGFVVFAAGWIGAGDVKLASASLLWLGAETLSGFLAVTALAGGILSLAALAVAWTRNRRRAGAPRGIRHLVATIQIPYAIPLSVAALAQVPQSQLAVGLGCLLPGS